MSEAFEYEILISWTSFSSYSRFCRGKFVVPANAVVAVSLSARRMSLMLASISGMFMPILSSLWGMMRPRKSLAGQVTSSSWAGR